jgi:Lsr2
MAKKQIVSVSYTCDVCGTEIPDTEGDGATRKVRWEGAEYVIDVCTTHASQLGDILSQLKGFVDVGYRAGLRRGRRPAAVSTRASRGGHAGATSASNGAAPKRGDLGAIRSWAQASGLKVGDRGRIPAAVVAAYEEAQGASSPAPAAEPEPAAPAAKAAPKKRAPRKAAANGGGAAKAAPRKRAPRKAAASA